MSSLKMAFLYQKGRLDCHTFALFANCLLLGYQVIQKTTF